MARHDCWLCCTVAVSSVNYDVNGSKLRGLQAVHFTWPADNWVYRVAIKGPRLGPQRKKKIVVSCRVFALFLFPSLCGDKLCLYSDMHGECKHSSMQRQQCDWYDKLHMPRSWGACRLWLCSWELIITQRCLPPQARPLLFVLSTLDVVCCCQTVLLTPAASTWGQHYKVAAFCSSSSTNCWKEIWKRNLITLYILIPCC